MSLYVRSYTSRTAVSRTIPTRAAVTRYRGSVPYHTGVCELFSGGADTGGVVAGYAATYAPQMKDIGAKYHRQWVMWGNFQATDTGALDADCVSLLDGIISAAAANGMEVYCLLHYPPGWANGESSTAANNARVIPGNGDPADATFQAFVQDYKEFCVLMVNQYKNRVKKWEIWLEPDQGPTSWRLPAVFNPTTGAALPNASCPADLNTWTKRVQRYADGYAYMLSIVYPAMKAADPNCTIIMGGCTVFSSDTFMPRFYAYGNDTTKNYFDIANIHPLPNNQNPDTSAWIKPAMNTLLASMTAAGDQAKPIWILTGYTTTGTVAIGYDPITEAQQAAYLLRVLNIIADDYPTVEHVEIFRLLDRGPWYNSTDVDAGFGLVATDEWLDHVTTGHAVNDHKPAYTAVKNFLGRYRQKGVVI